MMMMARVTSKTNEEEDKDEGNYEGGEASGSCWRMRGAARRFWTFCGAPMDEQLPRWRKIVLARTRGRGRWGRWRRMVVFFVSSGFISACDLSRSWQNAHEVRPEGRYHLRYNNHLHTPNFPSHYGSY